MDISARASSLADSPQLGHLGHQVCRRLMTTPGVGPVVALTYRATVDVPARFRKSKAVGAVFGLTCSKYQSGEIDRSGKISLRRRDDAGHALRSSSWPIREADI